MVNVFPPDHVDDLPEVEPNQPEPVLVDESEEPKEEEEFKDEEEFEEEEPQEEEENMEVDIEEEENELELIFPYVEADPLNPPPPAPDSKSEDVVEVENMIKLEDETVPNSVHEVGESFTATFIREDGDSLLPGFMRRDIKYLFGNEVWCSLGEREAVLEDIIKDFGNAEERVECKKLKKELEETRSSNTLLHIQKERVERDFYWTIVQAHEFYREMICRGVVFEERLNGAIDVPFKDEESPSSEPRESPPDS
ncbi:hypothetical protein Tco_1155356 [Tanacetum coccineum]